MGKTLSVDNTYGNVKICDVGDTYYSGTQLTGRVVIDLCKDFPSNILHLVLKGKEKVKLLKTVDGTHVNHHNDSNHNNSRFIKEKCEVFNISFPLYAAGPVFPKGTHELPFVINLPPDMPPSFAHKFYLYGDENGGKVYYKLAVALQSPDKSAAIFDQKKLEIKRGFNPIHTINSQPSMNEMKKHDFHFIAQINKQYAFIGDSISAAMKLDNSKSSSEVKKMKWKTIMRTKLRAEGKVKEIRTRIDKIFFEAVKPQEIFNKVFSIPINVPKSKDFKNPVTYNGTLIENTFEIEFSAVTSALWLFSKDNSLKFDITVTDRSPDNHNSFMQPIASNQQMNHNPYGPPANNFMPLNPNMNNQPQHQFAPNPNAFMPINNDANNMNYPNQVPDQNVFVDLQYQQTNGKHYQNQIHQFYNKKESPAMQNNFNANAMPNNFPSHQYNMKQNFEDNQNRMPPNDPTMPSNNIHKKQEDLVEDKVQNEYYPDIDTL